MWFIRVFWLVVFSLAFATSEAFAQDSAAPNDCSVEITLDGAIGSASLDLLDRGLKRTKEYRCKSMLILINTPGGSLQTTRMIVERILASPVPIMCLVYPSGGHAGSAGAIILQACHVAGAMEATNIGAATPVASTGQEIPKDLRQKLLNDSKSWLDGITELRERSKKFGRDIITEAKAVSAREALKLGAIDFVAQKKSEFLDFAKGRSVKMSEGRIAEVDVGEVITFVPDYRHKIVTMLTDPQTAYMMFMGSLGLLYFEMTHPE